MADAVEGFELSDNAGSTVQYSGTAGTGGVSIPPSPDKIIAEFFIQSKTNNRDLLVKLGANTEGWTIQGKGVLSWSLKGSIKQIHIASDVGNVSYDAIINYEDY